MTKLSHAGHVPAPIPVAGQPAVPALPSRRLPSGDSFVGVAVRAHPWRPRSSPPNRPLSTLQDRQAGELAGPFTWWTHGPPRCGLSRLRARVGCARPWLQGCRDVGIQGEAAQVRFGPAPRLALPGGGFAGDHPLARAQSLHRRSRTSASTPRDDRGRIGGVERILRLNGDSGHEKPSKSGRGTVPRTRPPGRHALASRIPTAGSAAYEQPWP